MRRTRQYGEHNDTRQDPLSAEERALQVMRIENASTALIDFGVKTVKNNPGKVGGWLVGLLICLLFSGFQVSQESYAKHDQVRRSIDFHSLYEAEDLMFSTKKDYDRRKGWFWTCNKDCQVYKKIYEQERAAFAVLEKQKVEKVREANAEIGLLSTVGVEDTRNKFWSSFDGGKRFATRQSKWDALFMGISALQKNEKISSYLLRVFMNFIMNFTLGVVMAVIGFWVALWGLMVEYVLTHMVFYLPPSLLPFRVCDLSVSLSIYRPLPA